MRKKKVDKKAFKLARIAIAGTKTGVLYRTRRGRVYLGGKGPSVVEPVAVWLYEQAARRGLPLGMILDEVLLPMVPKNLLVPRVEACDVVQPTT